MKRVLCLVLLLMMLCAAALAESGGYTWTLQSHASSYDSETLRYSIDVGKLNRTKCYLVQLYVSEPARQIQKATAPWHKKLGKSEDLAKKIPGAALVVNGSGYVSRLYPEIPENYPGVSEDYWYTPLGSVTVIGGEVMRCLEGVPYYGLTLEEDGLHMYVGEDPQAVLARHPIETWSFYEGCTLYQDGVRLLDDSWDFAQKLANRTIIARLDANNYILLIGTSKHGLTLTEALDFLIGEYSPEWVYNLDGGTSTALLRRLHGKKTLKLIYGGTQSVFDMMGFVE